jgi:SAM-dependent methyltransferase
VLDVACGTGLLAAELVARGHRVVGVDASEEMLDRARCLVGPDVELIRDSLPDLAVGGRFDAVVCTLDGLTYLEPAELPAAFASFAERIRPDGWLVFDVHTDAMMALALSRPVVTGEQSGYRFTIASAVDRDARASDTRIEITPAGDASFAEQHRQHFHREPDIRVALAGAGLEVTAVRDGYSGRPADDATLSATWIARRR